MNMKTTKRRTLSTKLAGALMLLLAATVGTGSVSAQKTDCDAACVQAKVDRHLILMGEFDNDEILAASLRDLIAIGEPALRATEDTYASWSRVEEPEPQGDARPAEMRWRAIHLMGSLSQHDAVPSLFKIAATPLPDPRLDEDAFADEVRIQLRAVAGLEKLGAVDELKELYSMGGVLRNATATSLFELGVNVGNVTKTDARTALAEEKIEPSNGNPKAEMPVRGGKPGSRTFEMKPKLDTPAAEQPKN